MPWRLKPLFLMLPKVPRMLMSAEAPLGTLIVTFEAAARSAAETSKTFRSALLPVRASPPQAFSVVPVVAELPSPAESSDRLSIVALTRPSAPRIGVPAGPGVRRLDVAVD